MVPETTSSDWIIPQILVYERKKEEYKKRVWNPWVWRLILWGIPLILLWGILGVYVPVIAAEFRYQVQSTKTNLAAAVPEGMIPNLSFVTLPVWVKGYSLEIPKISVQEPVMESVDVTNQNVYMSALEKGVAHAAGTGLPGGGGVQYYFAHSSGLPFWGERAVVFALLNKLETGDEVNVYREDRKYEYAVVEKLIVKPEDVTWLTSRTRDEQVVLQTCWPIGTNWKRLLVIAKPVTPDVSGVDRSEGFGKISIAMKGTN